MEAYDDEPEPVIFDVLLLLSQPLLIFGTFLRFGGPSPPSQTQLLRWQWAFLIGRPFEDVRFPQKAYSVQMDQ